MFNPYNLDLLDIMLTKFNGCLSWYDSTNEGFFKNQIIIESFTLLRNYQIERI